MKKRKTRKKKKKRKKRMMKMKRTMMTWYPSYPLDTHPCCTIVSYHHHPRPHMSTNSYPSDTQTHTEPSRQCQEKKGMEER